MDTSRLPALVLLPLCVLLSSQPQFISANVAQDIEDMVTTMMRCRDIPGLSLSVVFDGETVLKKGFGLADIEANTNVTEQTLFAIASVSKQMTATLLALLMHEHSVPWDRRVKSLLPDFETWSDFVTNTTTITDVVGHRTGIRSNDIPWLAGELSREETFKRLRFSHGNFRDTMYYNNVVFSIAGKLSEVLGGRKWETLMRERIFEPLGMTSTTFFDEEAPNWRNFAKAYTKLSKNESFAERDPMVIRYVGGVGPAGSISSNADDMLKYLHFLVSGGKTSANKTLVPVKVLKQVFHPTMTLPEGWFAGVMVALKGPWQRSLDNYGRGWALGRYRGYKIINHGGNLFGHDGYLTYIPKTKSAFYSVANGPSGAPVIKAHVLLHNYLAALATGTKPWLNETTICTYPQPWGPADDFYYSSKRYDITKTNQFQRPVDDYLGKYGNYELGNVTLLKTEQGRLQMNYGKVGRFTLYPQTEKDKFYILAIEAFSTIPDFNSWHSPVIYVEFVATNSGRVGSVKVSFFNPMAPPTFIRDRKLSEAPKNDRPAEPCGPVSDSANVVSKLLPLFLCVILGKLFCL